MYLTKPQRDALLIIYYGIDRDSPKHVIQTLLDKNLIFDKGRDEKGKHLGWGASSTGREFVKSIRHGS